MTLTPTRLVKFWPNRPLGDVFDRRLNGLNALRLLLAAGVVVWHSFPLTGRSVDWPPAHLLLEFVWVDGFFAISGFLILSSWMNNPSPHKYLAARFLRILPAYYVCLVLTVVVFVPISIWLSASSEPPWSASSLSYLYKNAALWIFQYDVGETTSELPYPGAINGSLWTLAWEFFCYILVMFLGVSGLLKFRATLPLCFAGAWAMLFLTWNGEIESSFARFGARFAVAFLAGALLYTYRDKLTVSWKLVALSGCGVCLSAHTPFFGLVFSPLLAYFLIGLGALSKTPKLQFRNDLSYGLYIYAFPVQQTLAMAGLVNLPVSVFASLSLAVSLCWAAASWFLIEKPILRFKPQITGKVPPSSTAS